jgi:hypothetical protein
MKKKKMIKRTLKINNRGMKGSYEPILGYDVYPILGYDLSC